MSYADVDQLAARWRPLTDDEYATAGILLGDADVQLRVEIPDLAERLEAGDADLLAAVIRVECAMVKRAMSVTNDAYGVTSAQETQGPFSRTLSYSNPMGDLYVTKAERRLLTGGAQRAFTIDQGNPDGIPWVLDELAYVKAAAPNSLGLSGFEA